MDKIDQEKNLLEEQASRIFCDWYTLQFQQKMSFLHLNSPSKPDASCLLNGRQVDLEIAHLYGSQAEAMQILGKPLEQRTLDDLQHLEQSTSIQQRLVKALNRILSSKAHKHYDSAHPWLVIRNAHPAWQADDIRENCKQIKLTSNHPFEQIWIIGDWQGKSGVVKLYPK